MKEELLNLLWAIEDGNSARVTQLVADNPHLLEHRVDDSTTWLVTAAVTGRVEMVQQLLDMGCDVNSFDRLGTACSSALARAIDTDHERVARLLLQRGANPDLEFDRPLIGAVNERKTPQQRLAFVKLLVEHGANVNRLYELYGKKDQTFTVLDWTDDPAVVEYLRAHGAKTAAELKEEMRKRSVQVDALQEESTPADEVIRYFGDNFGTVDKRAIVEIIPTGHSIAIHAVRPEGNRQHLTLFTTGLSDQPMATPPGNEEFAFAELFVQLPGDWPCGHDCPPEKAWIIHWLRKIAQYPHDNNTWLGGLITVIDNGDPPQPLGPDVNFTSWFLFAEKSFHRSDGQVVQLYRLTPIFSDERDLELREGAPELMRAFDRGSVPFIVDPERRSVVR